ncbi:MAG TPA: hypothetical protein PLX55_01370 [bacterium]|jgi:hypothetical protein|nr:hypothetical protein [Patescibacteria group bacterium]HPM27799.1 hypothetical protein [bacterium]
MLKKPSLSARLLFGLAYFSVVFLVPLALVKQDDQFGAFHVRNGFMIFVVTILGSVLLLFLDELTGGNVYPYVGKLFNLVVVIASVYGLISALRGRMDPIWGIHQLVNASRI